MGRIGFGQALSVLGMGILALVVAVVVGAFGYYTPSLVIAWVSGVLMLASLPATFIAGGRRDRLEGAAEKAKALEQEVEELDRQIAQLHSEGQVGNDA